jgi:small GTP-binding protein
MMHPAFKVALVGDSGVGKTAIFKRLQYGTFEANPASTVGGSFAQIMVPIGDGSQISVGMWDTAGQERFRMVVPMYFQRASLLILVFDLTNRATFNGVDQWRALAAATAPQGARLLLLGSKEDLAATRAVEIAAGKAKADVIGAFAYVETSAKTGAGFDLLLAQIGGIATEISGGEDVAAMDLHVTNPQPVNEDSCC